MNRFGEGAEGVKKNKKKCNSVMGRLEQGFRNADLEKVLKG
jgi:hypothetical protein